MLNMAILEVDFLMCIRILICMPNFNGSSLSSFLILCIHSFISSSFMLAYIAPSRPPVHSNALFWQLEAPISIRVIPKAIIEHDPDSVYMSVFSSYHLNQGTTLGNCDKHF